MISEVFITCAVTGGGCAPKQKNIPVTPQEIAASAIDAARAGASAVHLHVGDLKTRRGVLKPELEVFDMGHLMMVRDLAKEGLIDGPPLVQYCMNLSYGAPDDLVTLMAMVNQLPAGSVYSAFSLGHKQLPYALLAPMIGANVRVGLEDNPYLSHGRLATNAELVQRAIEILGRIGVRVLSPNEMREKLKLKRRA